MHCIVGASLSEDMCCSSLPEDSTSYCSLVSQDCNWHWLLHRAILFQSCHIMHNCIWKATHSEFLGYAIYTDGTVHDRVRLGFAVSASFCLRYASLQSLQSCLSFYSIREACCCHWFIISYNIWVRHCSRVFVMLGWSLCLVSVHTSSVATKCML